MHINNPLRFGAPEFVLFFVVLLVSPIWRLEPFGIIFFVYLLFCRKYEIILPGAVWALLSIIILNQFVLFELEIILSSISFAAFVYALFHIQKIEFDISRSFLLKFMALVEAAFLLDIFYQFYSGYDFLGIPLLNGYKVTGPYPTTYVDTLSVIFIFKSLFILESKHNKSTEYVKIVLWTLVQFMSGSRSAILLAPSIVLIYSIVKFKPMILVKAVLLSLLVLAIGLSTGTISDQISNKFWAMLAFDIASGSDDSLGVRLDLWRYNIELIINNLHMFIIGHGFSSFPFFDYIYGQRPHNIMDAQSNWLDLFNSVGFIGALLFAFSLYKYNYLTYVVRAGRERFSIFAFVFWMLSPLSVQHRLEATWFQCQILFGFVLLSALISVYGTHKKS
jgi:hypothetical protein